VHDLLDRVPGAFLTEPKPTVWFDPPAAALAPARLAARASRDGLRLDRRTRMAWRGNRVFANGEAIEAGAPARRWLRRLADARALSAPECRSAFADPALADLLHRWHASGWLLVGAAPIVDAAD
jgi:50S ribosomal protein L16 3-hydroxylase